MNDIESLLYVEIEDEFEKISKIKEVGSESHRAAVDGLSKLMDRAIEIRRIDIEAQEKVKDRENENFYREAQMAEDKKDRLIRNCISAAGIIIPSVITIWGTIKSLKFEETGTVTTIMGRGFINKLLPKK